MKRLTELPVLRVEEVAGGVDGAEEGAQDNIRVAELDIWVNTQGALARARIAAESLATVPAAATAEGAPHRQPALEASKHARLVGAVVQVGLRDDAPVDIESIVLGPLPAQDVAVDLAEARVLPALNAATCGRV